MICIEDPLRPEAGRVIASLRSRGIDRVVMLTGDSCVCAAAVARTLGIDEYHAQVLPEDKASYVEELCARGRHVIMVGDGINDSPALAKADVSVALNDASDIARAVADVTVLNLSTVAVTALNATPLLRGRAAHDQEDQEEEPVDEAAKVLRLGRRRLHDDGRLHGLQQELAAKPHLPQGPAAPAP